MSNYRPLLLLAIVLIGLLLRVYKIENPVADWHSWRQADTAAVTRNFEKSGFNPLYPRYDDLSNIQSGLDNPEGYRFVEFPLYQSIVYIVSSLFSIVPVTIEVWHRMVSITFSLGSIVLIYLLGRQYANERVGMISAFFYAVLPFSVYYSRVILPEVLLVFFILLTLYLFSRSIIIEKMEASVNKSFFNMIFIHLSFFQTNLSPKINYTYFVLFIISAAIALLIKPVAVFFFLPVPVLWIMLRLFTVKQIVSGAIAVLLIVTPLIIWRMWMQQFPEGIPAWDWLFNSDGIRFTGAFFRWLFVERLARLILGYYGVALLIFGILSTDRVAYKPFFTSLAVGSLLYISIFATGNVRHDYYQVILLPVVVFYLGIGTDYVLQQTGNQFRRELAYGTLAVVILFMLMFSWYDVRGYYWINNPAIVEAGHQADALLPPDAKVIAPYGGDTAFLYQTNRQGWPIGFEIEDKISKGATHYVSVTPDDPEAIDLSSRYTVLTESDSLVIIELQ